MLPDGMRWPGEAAASFINGLAGIPDYAAARCCRQIVSLAAMILVASRKRLEESESWRFKPSQTNIAADAICDEVWSTPRTRLVPTLKTKGSP